MTRLTEALYKSGGARNPNVNLKKFMNYTKTVNNWKFAQTPLLGNRVKESSIDNAGAFCREDMLVLMNCWKRHEFKEGVCSEEYQVFSKCIKEARAKLVQQQKFGDTDQLGVKGSESSLNPKQANKLLRMYPQPPYQITLTHGMGKPLHRPVVLKRDSEDNSQKSMMKPLSKKPWF